MADGHIKIKVEVDGKQVEVASKELDNLAKSGQQSGKGVKDAEDSLKGVGKESERAGASIKKIATSLGLVAIGAVAFKVLKASLDDAIARFDTLNKFPKVLQALGVSAEDSERAMRNLADGIDGLPTKLDDIANTAQRMYTSFGDMDKATDSALALNNALLASGADAGEAQRGTEMYLKALQTGEMDLVTWRSLQQNMSLALVKVSEAFGMTEQEMYKALQSGSVSIDQFNDKMIELGTGTGILVDLARENTLGIATSWENLKTAFARGLVEILNSLNKLSRATTNREIARNIDSLKHIIFASFKAISRTIDATTPIVKLFASAIKATIPVVRTLSPLIYGLMAAYGGYVVISRAMAIIQATNSVLAIATASTKGLTLVTTAQMTAQMASTTATKADVVAKAAQSGAVNILTLAIGVLTGKITLSTAAQTVATTATYAFGGAIRFLMGPVGWIITAIGLLTAGIVTLVKWYKRSTDEGKRLSKETEGLAKSTENLTENVKGNRDAYEENQREIQSTAKGNAELAKKIDELANKEKKSATEKRMLNSYIEELNGSVEGLALAYNEEANALNMSSKELEARIKLMKDMDDANSAQERLTEILREQAEAESHFNETIELRREWDELLKEGAVTGAEYAEAVENLNSKEIELKETLGELGEEFVIVEGQLTESMEKMIEMVESGAVSQSEMVEVWVANNEELVDNMRESYQEIYEITTNAFEKIAEESKVSADEMLENLKHNQETMKEWGENISELMGYASEHGYENFLHWLETLGPDSAAEVAVINEMSDAQLKEFAELMEKGAGVSTEAFGKALGEGMEESAKMLEDYITELPKTMQQQARDANFENVGEDIVEGFIKGMVDTTPQAEDAARDLVKATEDAARDESETHSPSRVFERIGGDLTDGLTLGINDGTSSVIRAMTDLLRSTIQPFMSINSVFYNIGTDATRGLNSGLNAGASSVYATANRIANNVAATMKRALEIRSPSVLMRDEVGKMIPAGITAGIEDEAKYTYRALEMMSHKMTDFVMPDVALARSMGNNVSKTVNQSSQTTNNHNNVNMDGLFNGANFHVRDEHDVERLAKEFNDYIRNSARGHGVIMP